MNIFGVGGAELVLILLIMLIVAGPKRMARWAYVLGTYVGKLRVVWGQMMDTIQAEIDEAGIDVQLPRTPPTRQDMNQFARDAARPFTAPVEDAWRQAKQDVSEPVKSARDEANAAVDLGTWQQDDEPPASAGDDTTPEASDGFGSWSQPAKRD